MQQATRISDRTAFFLLGKLVEFDETERMFSTPLRQENGGLYNREVRIMRTAFDEQLKQLRQELIGMSGECEEALARATGAFMTGDGELAATVIRTAEGIDRRERDIEAMCLKLLLMQHPVATDLRTVSSALKMVTDLERIGNQSADIADIVRTASFSDTVERQTIHDMAQAVIGMVSGSVDAFCLRRLRACSRDNR